MGPVTLTELYPASGDKIEWWGRGGGRPVQTAADYLANYDNNIIAIYLYTGMVHTSCDVIINALHNTATHLSNKRCMFGEGEVPTVLSQTFFIKTD